MQINAYLLFNGNCEEAMNFYQEALDGKIESISRYADSPMPADDDLKDKIMHGVLDTNGSRLLFSDAHGPNVAFGDNISISLSFKSDGDINRTFEALSTGGTVTLPLQDMFWGAKFGMCKDKFGINWMFSFDKPKK